MNCLICRQDELIDGYTSIAFEREEFRLLIRKIPAQICPSCGEAVVDEETAIHLLHMTDDAVNEGIFESVSDYSVKQV